MLTYKKLEKRRLHERRARLALWMRAGQEMRQHSAVSRARPHRPRTVWQCSTGSRAHFNFVMQEKRERICLIALCWRKRGGWVCVCVWVGVCVGICAHLLPDATTTQLWRPC